MMTAADVTILTVTQLNRLVRQFLETGLSWISVEGEASNVSYATSGHCYFTLKDKTAQIKCVFFKGKQSVLIQNGDSFILKGKLTVYEARGDYQLIVDSAEKAGLGYLYQQFIALKTKLQTAGLFDPHRKKIIPHFCEHIGVITSSKGAALHDIQTTLHRRYPLAKHHYYYSDVQGDQAVHQLIAALRKANDEQQCDVLILARGGGSLEDLNAFNQEQLAYAILESKIPIVTGIGHETDFTIADFVADFRAATPTAAAEKVTPDCKQLLQYCVSIESRLMIALRKQLQRHQMRLNHCQQALKTPEQRMQMHQQTIDFTYKQLIQTMQQKIDQHRTHLQLHMQHLHALSPLATLSRGYAIASNENGECLRDPAQIELGQMIHLQLEKGKLRCQYVDNKSTS